MIKQERFVVFRAAPQDVQPNRRPSMEKSKMSSTDKVQYRFQKDTIRRTKFANPYQRKIRDRKGKER